jgi:hypothetical protein
MVTLPLMGSRSRAAARTRALSETGDEGPTAVFPANIPVFTGKNGTLLFGTALRRERSSSGDDAFPRGIGPPPGSALVFDVTTENASIPPPAVARGLDETLRSWKSLAEWLPVGVCVCDRDGLLAFFNSHAAALWGQRPRLGDPQFRFCGAYRVHAEDGGGLAEEPPMSEVLRGPCASASWCSSGRTEPG